MRRSVFGGFAIAGGLALWAAIGASAQGSTTAAASFDPTKECPSADQLVLKQSLSGVSAANAAEAAAELQELNAEASLANSEIIAEANGALAELTAEHADESSDEDGTTALTLDAKILAIKTAACQALGNLVSEYNAAIAALPAEFTQPNNDDKEKPAGTATTREHDTEREAPESDHRISSSERSGDD